MSRSNNVELKNPAERFFKWDGENGGFNYFDKNLGERGERVHVSLPFEFIVLDTLSTITGFDDANQGGYWSNEVRNVSEDPLIIKNKNGVVVRGLYQEIKDKAVGSRFCQSVYIAYSEGGVLHIGNIHMVGIALSAWIEYRKKGRIFSGSIKVAKMKDGQKGKAFYKIPVFTWCEINEAQDNEAKLLDRALQVYLDKYFNAKKQETVEEVAVGVATEEIQKEDLPF